MIKKEWCGIDMYRSINISGDDMDKWLVRRVDDVDSLHVEIEKS